MSVVERELRAPAAPVFWHQLSADQTVSQLATRPEGLTLDEVRQRQAQYGLNRLPEPTPPSFWYVLFRQFLNPLIYILMAAMVVCILLGEYTDAMFIAGVLLINALIGAVQEFHAQRSAASLRQLISAQTRVLREGHIRELPAEQLVPGDWVLLASGDRVPADIRLFSADGLEIDESFLTGESMPVHKQADATLGDDTPVAERHNMAFAGSMVTLGRARGIVVNTGVRTEVGRLAQSLVEEEVAKPPLIQRMEKFSHNLMIALLLVVTALGLIEVSRGTDLVLIFMTAVALAVSAIPEGLPVALTVALSVGTRRMARRNVIVRKLVAVEALGSCTVIASDKTGTLTVNRLTARDLRLPDQSQYRCSGEGLDPSGSCEPATDHSPPDHPALHRLLRIAALCNEGELNQTEQGWEGTGDAVDLALLVLNEKCGHAVDRWRRKHPTLLSIPYEPELGYAASQHASEHLDGEGRLICVKGAPERVLAMCSTMATADGAQSLDREQMLQLMQAMAAEGSRVLAFADAHVEPGFSLSPERLQNLCFVGLVGMLDPVRPEALGAVRACKQAGLRVCMLTGDHPRTAEAIARELELLDCNGNVVTGAELADAEAAGEAALDALVKQSCVYARVAPEQKLSIVKSLTRQGEFVAVTGDGVNDAPALNYAHVGVAMGQRGTDVAREASDLLLTDDNFASVVSGVEQGRIAYQNVRKVVYLLISTGAAEVFLFLLSTALGMPMPLTAVQLLWLNLVTNGIQDVALAFEPAEGDEMRKPPRRPEEGLFNRLMLERVLLSAFVVGGLSFICFSNFLAAGMDVYSAQNSTLLLLVLFENVQVFNSRSETLSVFRHALNNKLLIGGTLLAQGVHIAAMYWPAMQPVLGVHPVSLEHWTNLLVVAFSILLVMELHKLWWKRQRQSLPIAG